MPLFFYTKQMINTILYLAAFSYLHHIGAYGSLQWWGWLLFALGMVVTLTVDLYVRKDTNIAFRTATNMKVNNIIAKTRKGLLEWAIYEIAENTAAYKSSPLNDDGYYYVFVIDTFDMEATLKVFSESHEHLSQLTQTIAARNPFQNLYAAVQEATFAKSLLPVSVTIAQQKNAKIKGKKP